MPRPGTPPRCYETALTSASSLVRQVLGLGSFGQAELRRVSDSDGVSDGSFVVVKRVPLQTLGEWGVGALVGEVINGAAMRHRHAEP